MRAMWVTVKGVIPFQAIFKHANKTSFHHLCWNCMSYTTEDIRPNTNQCTYVVLLGCPYSVTWAVGAVYRSWGGLVTMTPEGGGWASDWDQAWPHLSPIGCWWQVVKSKQPAPPPSLSLCVLWQLTAAQLSKYTYRHKHVGKGFISQLFAANNNRKKISVWHSVVLWSML